MQTLNNKTKLSFVMKNFFLMMSFVLTANLWAQAGTSLFTYGKVNVRHASGEILDLTRGMELNSGDAVLTGVNGRAQLRMQDGAIFDLKPNSEFIIEQYVYSGNTTAAGLNVAAENDKGFYRLMRGGFRAISGLIGKKNKKNYRVTTPVATIGIRGTDYTVDICDLGCTASMGKGMYLSVAEGGVILINDGGTLDIDPGQVGYAANNSTAPVLTSQAQVSESSSSDEQAKLEKTAEDSDGNVVSLESGEDLVETPDEPVVLNGVPGRVAVAVNGMTEQSDGTNANLVIGDRGAVSEFTTDTATYTEGTTVTKNQGFDESTGLYWGRWTNGTAEASTDAGTSDVDLDSSSAHWIYTTNQVTPTIPLTGEANFDLVGNTNPTDSHGNSGVLGSANLSADFTNQTVDADVNLTINEQTWDANANDVALDGDAASFSGEFDEVVITDNSDGSSAQGSGELDGFFTADDNGDVSGAGMTYTLSDDADTTVEGSAAFEVEDSKPAQ